MNTRDSIVAGAWACIQERGVKRANIAEIARQSGVSRATVYQYFADKREIIDAVVAGASKSVFKLMGQAMAQGIGLRAQLALAARFLAAHRQSLHQGQAKFDAAGSALLLIDESGELLQGFTTFLEPYVAAAQMRGEIRSGLNPVATSEWFARILMSLYVTRSQSLDLDDPAAAAQFVTDHFVIASDVGAPEAVDPIGLFAGRAT
ncbi:TetR/AcrR family transcriptional regulator [Mycobacterium sp. NPDC051804]|uniref:TetR/AcrR family transcriptional regulator n=1 Tax=Mycobacterium sp. NPDC051804 TaxID=3364295 RepID=UPI0037B1F1D0